MPKTVFVIGILILVAFGWFSMMPITAGLLGLGWVMMYRKTRRVTVPTTKRRRHR